MIQLGISDISKNPSLIDKVDDLVEILNKKTKEVKGVFIPSALFLVPIVSDGNAYLTPFFFRPIHQL